MLEPGPLYVTTPLDWGHLLFNWDTIEGFSGLEKPTNPTLKWGRPFNQDTMNGSSYIEKCPHPWNEDTSLINEDCPKEVYNLEYLLVRFTYSFEASSKYLPVWRCTLSNRMSRKACLLPATDTAHMASVMGSWSPRTGFGNIIPESVSTFSTSTTAREAWSTTLYR